MTLYVYVKAPVKNIKSLPQNNLSRKKLAKISAIISTVFGLIFISLVGVPFLYYQFILGPSLTKQEILRPVPLVSAQENGTKGTTSNLDYTKASNWFPKATPQTKVNSAVSSYTLSIPDLRIKDATVIIGAENLDKSLIHYGGTGLPGEYGNAVIYGHSALPIFYNPANYMTIFATLQTLKNGAKVIINYDGITYTYEVFDKIIVGPDDLSVLAQTYNDITLSLITCYPPGTILKRLVVRARLVRPNSQN